MHTQDTNDLLQGLNKLISDVSFGKEKNSKREALRLSKALTATLEEPETAAVEMAFSSFIPMSIRIAVGLNLFEHIVNHEGPITLSQLAPLSGAEELFIKRTLRPLSASRFVKEVAEDTWEATPISKAMTQPGIAAGYRLIWDMEISCAVKAPKYFEETGYKCPTNPLDGLTQYTHQTKLLSFQYYTTMPRVITDFNTFMGSTMGARNYWTDWFPVNDQILKDATGDSALIVDVGGGRGHDLQAFHEKFPGKGKLVLQDLPHVLEEIQELDASIERSGYDFFTMQPIKDARVYFYHHILHDWSDYKCLEILKGLRQAMKPGYSKLLLHEMIIPEKGASQFHAMLDMTMMIFNSGMERTGKQFTELLDKAGFEVVNIWLPDEDDADGIVEAMVKKD